MKKFFVLLVFLHCMPESLLSQKGLYVDGFASILGNTNKEDSLLNYAQQNGFTYLALYELHLVHASNNLTTLPTSAPLANFINRAKTLYGVQEIGACGENFWWFDNIISVYNTIHTNSNEKIDVYNFEFEFWNLASVGPGQYYCTTYLTPGGFSCDTSGAFAFYMDELISIDSLANIDGATSELYVGWFNQYQATEMIQHVDRILLHSYVNNVANVYSYAQTRLSYLGSGSQVVNVMPIFSSEPGFLGPWLNSNSESEVAVNYSIAFAAEPGAWKANINLIGYQWFAYSFMPYGLPASIVEESVQFNVYPNPTHETMIIESLVEGPTSISIFNLQGCLVSQFNSNEKVIHLDLLSLPKGLYHLVIKAPEDFVSYQFIKL